jgi:hypothetical protein
MAETLAPVAIHLWFADGDGWAYHPALSGDTFQWIVKEVQKHLHSSKDKESINIRSTQRQCRLVGYKMPQKDCEDPKAKNRSPFVLRVAYLANETLADVPPQEVHNRLKELHPPTKRGQNASLEISLGVEAVTVDAAIALKQAHERSPAASTFPEATPALAANVQAQFGKLRRDYDNVKADNSVLRQEREHLLEKLKDAKSTLRAHRHLANRRLARLRLLLVVLMLLGILSLGISLFVASPGVYEVLHISGLCAIALIGLCLARRITRDVEQKPLRAEAGADEP